MLDSWVGFTVILAMVDGREHEQLQEVDSDHLHADTNFSVHPSAILS